MRGHIGAVSWVLILFGLYQLAVALLIGGIFVVVGTGMAGAGVLVGGEDGLIMALMGGIYGTIGAAVAVMAGVMSMPTVLAGWGLRRRAGWARLLAIVVAILSVASPPVGTAIGIYVLVVMFNQDVADAFR